ncbi:hypothetical protein MMC28_006057 [Mycoblastus sanguinarius]|nr:hypothetical protein [Mycoblastus sanguinarius]
MMARFRRLWTHDLTDVLVDPFCLYVLVLDFLYAQALHTVNVVGEIFGPMERVALNLADGPGSWTDQQDFVGLHNLAKHMIHLKEGADATLSTVQRLLDHHQDLIGEFPKEGPAVTTMKLVHQRLKQKSVQFEVWKLRVTSLQQRMQNVINLSFNVVTQRDSYIMKNDSKSMRAIASVTVVFLPAATIAAVFGCQFFNFDSTSRTVSIATDFWIFWVLTLPLSLLIFVYYYWFCYLRRPEKHRRN